MKDITPALIFGVIMLAFMLLKHGDKIFRVSAPVAVEQAVKESAPIAVEQSVKEISPPRDVSDSANFATGRAKQEFQGQFDFNNAFKEIKLPPDIMKKVALNKDLSTACINSQWKTSLRARFKNSDWLDGLNSQPDALIEEEIQRFLENKLQMKTLGKVSVGIGFDLENNQLTVKLNTPCGLDHLHSSTVETTTKALAKDQIEYFYENVAGKWFSYGLYILDDDKSTLKTYCIDQYNTDRTLVEECVFVFSAYWTLSSGKKILSILEYVAKTESKYKYNGKIFIDGVRGEVDLQQSWTNHYQLGLTKSEVLKHNEMLETFTQSLKSTFTYDLEKNQLPDAPNYQDYINETSELVMFLPDAMTTVSSDGDKNMYYSVKLTD